MTAPSLDPVSENAPTGVISSTPPAAGEPAASPPSNRRLKPSLLVAALTLFATYGGLIAILLPSQIAMIDEANKVGNLFIVTTTSFVFTLFAQPLAGALSDRTRSRYGRRAPWMVIGALVGGIFLFGIGSLTDILWITVFWVVIQVALNFLQAPLTTITADRFPRSQRGGASAMIGLGTQLGMTVGVMLAAALGAQIGIGYSVFGAAVIVVTILFVLLNRDWSSKESVVEPFSWGGFFKGFWVNPRKHPDFFWAFTARFLLILGYFVVAAYQLYLLTDYIGMTLAEGQGAVVTLTLVALVPTIIAIILSGWWSDKIGRRKVFIYVASVVMVIGFLMPILMPNMTGMIAMSVINGIGFGLYMSVDAALMTEVLPSEGTAAGKDLGILNVATNIPQALSSGVAALIITFLGGYQMLFVFAMVFVVLAAIAIAPIKGVR
ncbi:MFS transporter [Microbacterium sp. H1-D42]|uniref:MFS transporter n=1 Tax=Microbacterium sp. H1-D42 TaxID=2925844 RepID=UPI001F539099|nr:MFS transporter [Microbacterium sp. H1-D42]UNK71355.1 MFS transporter [Microbacterium sp. H1-D42]